MQAYPVLTRQNSGTNALMPFSIIIVRWDLYESPADGIRMDSNLQTAGLLLRQVLAGELAPEAAEARWPDPEGDDRSLNAAMHALQHYRSDATRRSSDAEYARRQTDELLQMADRLATGQPLDSETLHSFDPLLGWRPRWMRDDG
jgi:hypothetical protein